MLHPMGASPNVTPCRSQSQCYTLWGPVPMLHPVGASPTVTPHGSQSQCYALWKPVPMLHPVGASPNVTPRGSQSQCYTLWGPVPMLHPAGAFIYPLLGLVYMFVPKTKVSGGSPKYYTLLIGRSNGEAPGTCPSSRSKFFHFHAFCSKRFLKYQVGAPHPLLGLVPFLANAGIATGMLAETLHPTVLDLKKEWQSEFTHSRDLYVCVKL